MKIAIIGSKNFDDYQYMKKILLFHLDSIKLIISGNARGADKLAKQYAGEHSIPIKEFTLNWDLYGKSAGYIRNQQIVEKSDEVIAFWNGDSKDTQHAINIAEELNKPVYIYWPGKQEATKDWVDGIGI